jgi:ubiquinone/menaquinone biosynthesis C-methylase UbiE
MAVSTMLAHLILERLSPRELPRVPEPTLIMDDPEQVHAFTQTVQEDGLLAPICFFHALQASPLVRAGDSVLDLACGPAHQLVQIARLNPEARFVGLDASSTMLERARVTLDQSRIDNVALMSGDMTHLSGIADASIDCVLCTMSLHHLVDLAALARMALQVRRVLKPGGGLYLADFGRLKRASTQHYFAQDRADCQSAQFTKDYFQSMQAAFSVKELASATATIGPGLQRYQTALAPFMVIIKSAERRQFDAGTRSLARDAYARMSAGQQRDFQNFARWFRASGYGLPCALTSTLTRKLKDISVKSSHH